MRRWWPLAALLLAYLALGGYYSCVVPVFEAPDEPYHFFVVKHLVDHCALPVQRAETRGLWEQEGSQPPLYYALGALLVRRIDLSDAEALLWRNPQANMGDPASPGNKNVYVHPGSQSQSWSGATLAVHVLRFFSLALGATTVALVHGIVVMIWPGQGFLAWVVAAFAAFIPQFLFITSSVNNDNAMTCLGTLSLYLLIRRLWRDVSELPGKSAAGADTGLTWRWIVLGSVLALAMLSKLSAIALIPLALVVAALVAWHRGSWRTFWQLGLCVLIPVLVIAGWWYARNVVLYGEPTGLRAMYEVVGRRTDFGQDLWGEFRGLRRSFWGLFGWFSIPMPEWVYLALDVLSGLALIGLGLALWAWLRRGLGREAWRSWRDRVPGWGAAGRPISLAILSLWLGVTLLSLVRWTSLTKGSQGRLLYGAVAAIAILLVVGVRSWLAGQHHRWIATGVLLSGAMLALAGAAPWAWIGPEYARPFEISQLPGGAIPQEVWFGDDIVLRGVRFQQDTVLPGDVLRLNLYWETWRPAADSPGVMVWLRLIQESPHTDDVAGGVVGLEDAYPGSGTFPIALWPVNRMIADRQYVRVGHDAQAPMVARLDVALYGEGERDLAVVGGGDPATIGRIKIVPRRWPRAGNVEARFDCGVSLAGHAVDGTTGPGQSVALILTWTVQSAPRRDYSVFAHLEDEQGTIWAYGDGAPRGGNYPTWWWSPGEVVQDERKLTVDPATPPGRYRLKVGLYGADGRVAAYATEGRRLPDDAVDLGLVEVR